MTYALFFMEENNKEKLYGCGPYEFIEELLRNYIVHNNLYEKKHIKFKIEKVKDYRNLA